MNKFINPKKRQEENIATINEVFSDLIEEFNAEVSTNVRLTDFKNEEYSLCIYIPQIFTKNDSKLFYSDIIQSKLFYLKSSFRPIKKHTWLSRILFLYYIDFMECVYYDDSIRFIINFKTI